MSKVFLKDIADIQSGPFGTQLHKNEYVQTGIPMLNAKNVGNGTIDISSLDCVTQAVCDRLPQYVVKKGDILFGRAGTIERHTYVSEQYDGSFQGTNCIRIRCHNTELSRYISYYLWHPAIKKSIENKTGGSIQSYITTDLLNGIVIDLPSEKTIKRVSDLLDAIDRGIEVNNRINDNLQQMAYETYMHLFFGKSTNGKLGDLIVENEKSTVQVGTAKDSADGEYPFFTSGDAILRWNTSMVDGRNCYLNTGGNADVKFYVGAAAYSTDTWCITATTGFEDYLYLLLLSIKSELNQKFFQGTGLKHLQKPLLKDRPIYIPDKNTIDEFNLSVQPWFDMIAANINENQRLISLRDWLLPMLMNGQATIAD